MGAALHGLAVADVLAGYTFPGQPCILEIYIVIVVDDIQSDYFKAVGQQFLCGVVADEAGGTGNEDFQGWLWGLNRGDAKALSSRSY